MGRWFMIGRAELISDSLTVIIRSFSLVEEKII